MKKVIAIIVVLAVVLIGGVIGGAYYVNQVQNYISTDDASVQGNIMTVSTLATGKLAAWNVKEGDKVQKGDVIGQVQLPAQKPGDNPTTVDIDAPADGTVIQSKAQVGQIVAPGVPLAMTANLSKLYVVANIKETNIDDVKVGQDVTITVDAVPNTSFSGKVEQIGLATSSTFSLLPSGNASGNYTKIVQRVPIKISFDGYEGKKIIPGLNAYVKISK